jgi:hypothetical protein
VEHLAECVTRPLRKCTHIILLNLDVIMSPLLPHSAPHSIFYFPYRYFIYQYDFDSLCRKVLSEIMLPKSAFSNPLFVSPQSRFEADSLKSGHALALATALHTKRQP